MRKPSFLIAAALLGFIPVMSSCSSPSQTKDTTPVMSLTPASIVIDVRSAAEFAGGHVQGAVNLDINNGSFQAKLSSLDKSVGYALYCRSGSRSAMAAELMATAGFTEVRDLGALETAAQSLGLPIITE
jgi:rhodanese-related sulfurtransferase